MDYLNELMISSEDSPPSPPSVNDEHKHLLRYQLESFGFELMVEMPDSIINKNKRHWKILHDWLKEDDSDVEFTLLYRGSSDGLINQAFHSKCDNKGCTLTIIETTFGAIFGGYSNTDWSGSNSWGVTDKAFLFALSASSVLSPCKMKLKIVNDPHKICILRKCGPVLGRDMFVNGPTARIIHYQRDGSISSVRVAPYALQTKCQHIKSLIK